MVRREGEDRVNRPSRLLRSMTWELPPSSGDRPEGEEAPHLHFHCSLQISQGLDSQETQGAYRRPAHWVFPDWLLEQSVQVATHTLLWSFLETLFLESQGTCSNPGVKGEPRGRHTD